MIHNDEEVEERLKRIIGKLPVFPQPLPREKLLELYLVLLDQAHQKELEELLTALVGMYEQYCGGKYGHNFMSAGEYASGVMRGYGYEFDGSGRITKRPHPHPVGK